jgi:hypothetical protein
MYTAEQYLKTSSFDNDNISLFGENPDNFFSLKKFESFGSYDSSIYIVNNETNQSTVNEKVINKKNLFEESENNDTSSFAVEKTGSIYYYYNNNNNNNNNNDDKNNILNENDMNSLSDLLPLNNNNSSKKYQYKIIPEEKKKFMGRKRRNDQSERQKSWDNEMDVWKNIRVRINKSLFIILNNFSKLYGLNKFYSFNGKISTKKDINEKLLNESIKNYIIRQGISNNFNKGKSEKEQEIINKNNLHLIYKILETEKNNLNQNKPFTEFVNMEFKDFYFNIFINKDNKEINEIYKNKNNFYEFINDYELAKKKVYNYVATEIYKIYGDKKSRTPKIKNLL